MSIRINTSVPNIIVIGKNTGYLSMWCWFILIMYAQNKLHPNADNNPLIGTPYLIHQENSRNVS